MTYFLTKDNDLIKYLNKYFQSTFIPVAIKRTKNAT